MFKQKTRFLSISIAAIAVTAVIGTIIAMRAQAIDTSSCDGNLIKFYYDSDADGYGNPASYVDACSAPLNYVVNSNDCNDANAAVYQSAPEICDGIDNDCDGAVDEGLATSTYYYDADSDSYGISSSTVTSCHLPANYASSTGDCHDLNAAINPGAAELCDGIDNDCDGAVDEGLASSTYYRDADVDGYGNVNVSTSTCVLPVGYLANHTDCDDTRNYSHPGAPEICDSHDNNCNGTVDEGCSTTTTYYRDNDSDGYGDPAVHVEAASLPAGYAANDDDCNDANNKIYQGAPELCDGLDNDCDGSIDEGVATTTWYRDADGDNYGNNSSTTLSCVKPSGYVSNSTDCDDTRNYSHPGAPELCDSLDNDCDGTTDESCASATSTYYRDLDGDNYGDPNRSIQATSQPSGYKKNNTDCNDGNNAVHPGATEICDSLDNDCDGTVDENCSGNTTGCPCSQCTCTCTCTSNCNSGCNSGCGSGCNTGCNSGCNSGCGSGCNHGKVVSSVTRCTNIIKWAGEISGREKGEIVSQVAKFKNEVKIKYKSKHVKNNKNKNKDDDDNDD